jgi:hypothetical protein
MNAHQSVQTALDEAQNAKYTPWRTRRQPHEYQALFAKAWAAVSDKPGFTPSQKEVLVFHVATGCDGLEFTVRTPLHWLGPFFGLHGLVLVPMYDKPLASPSDPIDTQDPNSPYLRGAVTFRGKEADFEYDGWIPITVWDGPGIQSALDTIEQTINSFFLWSSDSLHPGAKLTWQPKYSHEDSTPWECIATPEMRSLIIRTLQVMERLEQHEQEVFSSALSAFRLSMGCEDPCVAFFFTVLSVEAVAVAIELDSKRGCPHLQVLARMHESLAGLDPARLASLGTGKGRAIGLQVGKWLGWESESFATLCGTLLNNMNMYGIRSAIAHDGLGAFVGSDKDDIGLLHSRVARHAGAYLMAVLIALDDVLMKEPSAK